MSTMPLTKGQVALVDDSLYNSLNQWKWTAHWSPTSKSYYAVRNLCLPNGKRYELSMHRFILGLPKGDKREGDHKNGNTLDNQRSNLRIASKSQNQRNARAKITNQSGLKGASRNPLSGHWVARITIHNGQRVHLGVFPTAESAHAAYCEAAKKFHGEFARTK